MRYHDDDRRILDDEGYEVNPDIPLTPRGLQTVVYLKRPKPPITPRNRAGFVYILAVPNTPGLFKIGRTVDLDDRLRTFSVKLPFQVRYEHTIKSSDCYVLETMLHHLFAAQRVDGEFFMLDVVDLSILKSMTGS